MTEKRTENILWFVIDSWTSWSTWIL